MKLKKILEFEDKIKGGKADDRSPEDFDKESLMKGIHVEFEHTDDIMKAMEIAMDHLVEDPKYYEKLASIDPHDNKGEKMKFSVEQIKRAIRESMDPKQWAEIVAKLRRMPVADREIAMQKMLSFLVRRIPSSIGSDFSKTFRNPTDAVRGSKQDKMPDLSDIGKSEDEPDLKSGGIIPAKFKPVTPHTTADRLHGIPKPPGSKKTSWAKNDPDVDVARQAFGLDKDTGAGMGPSLGSLARQAMGQEPKSVGPKPDTLPKSGKLSKLGKKVMSKIGGKKKEK